MAQILPNSEALGLSTLADFITNETRWGSRPTTVACPTIRGGGLAFTTRSDRHTVWTFNTNNDDLGFYLALPPNTDPAVDLVLSFWITALSANDPYVFELIVLNLTDGEDVDTQTATLTETVTIADGGNLGTTNLVQATIPAATLATLTFPAAFSANMRRDGASGGNFGVAAVIAGFNTLPA